MATFSVTKPNVAGFCCISFQFPTCGQKMPKKTIKSSNYQIIKSSSNHHHIFEVWQIHFTARNHHPPSLKPSALRSTCGRIPAARILACPKSPLLGHLVVENMPVCCSRDDDFVCDFLTIYFLIIFVCFFWIERDDLAYDVLYS